MCVMFDGTTLGGFAQGALHHSCCAAHKEEPISHLITVGKGRIMGEDGGATSNWRVYLIKSSEAFEYTTRPISDASFLKNQKKKHVFLHAKCLICVTLMAE